MKQLTIDKIDEVALIRFAQFCGAQASGQEIFLLEGDLGAGKTVFAKALAKGFGIKEHITSPTFTLINHYDSPQGVFVHIDLYRIDDPSEIDYLGIEEYYDDALMAIEWSGRLGELPSHFLKVEIEVKDWESRSLTCIAKGIAEEALLEEMDSFVHISP